MRSFSTKALKASTVPGPEIVAGESHKTDSISAVDIDVEVARKLLDEVGKIEHTVLVEYLELAPHRRNDPDAETEYLVLGEGAVLDHGIARLDYVVDDILAGRPLINDHAGLVEHLGIEVGKADAYLLLVNGSAECKAAVHVDVDEYFSSALLELLGIDRSFADLNENTLFDHLVGDYCDSSSCYFESACHVNS